MRRQNFEQCTGANSRIYRARELKLYDSEQERLDGPVISLIRSMPGIERADFLDHSSVLITISLKVKWVDVEEQILSLFKGDEACCEPRAEWINVDTLSKDHQKIVLAKIADAFEAEATMEAFERGLETWTPEELKEIYENY